MSDEHASGTGPAHRASLTASPLTPMTSSQLNPEIYQVSDKREPVPPSSPVTS